MPTSCGQLVFTKFTTFDNTGYRVVNPAILEALIGVSLLTIEREKIVSLALGQEVFLLLEVVCRDQQHLSYVCQVCSVGDADSLTTSEPIVKF